MRVKLALVIVLLVALVGCSASPTEVIADLTSNSNEAAEEAHTTHSGWSYEGATGQEHWAALSDEVNGSYALCGSGDHQSPINITLTEPQDVSNITFYYESIAPNVKNNGHTVEVHYAEGGFIEIAEERFKTANIHYHSPSEHTVNGEAFDAELHIVHVKVDANGNEVLIDNRKVYAVVGILLTTGTTEYAAYQPFLRTIAASTPTESNPGIELNAADLLPSNQTTYRYSGSLTTPPCTEGVLWNVMTTPVEVAPEQMAILQELFNGNKRLVQELHERSIIEDTTP